MNIAHLIVLMMIAFFAELSAVPADSTDSLPPVEKLPELKQFIQAEYPSEAL